MTVLGTNLRAAAIGATVFLVTQAFLPIGPGVEAPWFLNSGFGVILTVGALCAAAFLIERRESQSSRPRPFCFAGGATVAMIGYLIVVGPGNLLPIVIVFGMLAIFPPILLATRAARR